MATQWVGVLFKGDKMIRMSSKKTRDWGVNRWWRMQPEYNRFDARTIANDLVRCGEYEFRKVKLET
jgi:hypothetical protein